MVSDSVHSYSSFQVACHKEPVQESAHAPMGIACMRGFLSLFTGSLP